MLNFQERLLGNIVTLAIRVWREPDVKTTRVPVYRTSPLLKDLCVVRVIHFIPALASDGHSGVVGVMLLREARREAGDV